MFAGHGVGLRGRRLVAAGLAAALVVAGVVLVRPGPAAAAAPVLFSDDFQDGNAAGWRSTGGQWSVVEDGTQALRQASINSPARIQVGESSWADYSVGVQVKPLANRDTQSSVSVLARVQSDGSHYYLATRANDTVEMGRVVRGRSTVLATADYPAALQFWRTLTLVVKGSTLVGVVNGSPTLSATDTQLRRGRVGLATTYATATFDDVSVQSYAASTPDTQAPLTPGQPSIVEVTPTTATISWPASIDNVGVVDYLVYEGEQYYQQNLVRVVTGTGPVMLTFGQTGASIHFSVAARDAAGNVSPISSRTSMAQPPSFPRSGTETVPPSAPGSPVLTGTTADGRGILSWTPATDNIGVVEYHVYLVVNIDEIRVLAKVSQPTATVSVNGSNPLVRVVAYDAAWNSSTSPLVPYGPTPTTTPPPTGPPG
jgi:hypothetical protein